MAQSLDDAIAILTDLDEVHPDLMVTFTTNPNWREIQENLAPNQTYVDRPDIVARVFNLKLKALMRELTEMNFFGKTKAYFYVVEFQKRGLPHAHILLILDEHNKITDDNVDNFISAEFPDMLKNPRLFENYKKFQVHTPCDTDEDAWRFCRFNRKECEKRYPKDKEEKTVENPETGYSFYMRRDDGRGFFINRREMINRPELREQRQLFAKHGININDHFDDNPAANQPSTAKTAKDENVLASTSKSKGDEATTSMDADGVKNLTRLLRTTSIVPEAKSKTTVEPISDDESEKSDDESLKSDDESEQSDEEIHDYNLREIINNINYDEYNIDEEVEGDDEFLLLTETLPKKKVRRTKAKQFKKGYVNVDGVETKIINPVYEEYSYFVTNEWVVATNYVLSLMFNAHINVERCGAIRAVKYIFKYIYKGGDCANLVLTRYDETDGTKKLNYDEIQNRMGTYLNVTKRFNIKMIFVIIKTLDTRYVSSPEAVYRLFQFFLSGKSHFVYRLPVHLPDEQSIVFDSDQIDNDLEVFEEDVEAQAARDTQLTAWFKLNLEDAMSVPIKYCDMAEHYTWDKVKRKWNVRKIGHEFAISRIYPVSPGTELFYLRLLLLHVAGFTSYEDARTTFDEEGLKTKYILINCSIVTLKKYNTIGNRTVHEKFKEAAVARGLTLDDREYDECMREASRRQMPWQLRQLFFNICQELQASNYRTIFDNHKNAMMDDYKLKHPNTQANGTFVSDKERVELLWLHLLLRDLNRLFGLINKTNVDFDLEMPDEKVLNPYLYFIKKSTEFSFSRYTQAENRERGVDMFNQLNGDQHQVFSAIMDRVTGKIVCERNHFWVKGCGGTGKTFLLSVCILI